MLDPLVVTLQLEPEVQERFDAERRALFPPGRTQVGAHITLFHALPGAELDAVRAALAAEQHRGQPAVRVTGVRSLGRGAAYTLECADLDALHRRLVRAFEPWLTPQDRQPFRPHVTVQNKVDPAVARATVQELTAAFTPFVVRATGLELWRYIGGPWEAVGTYPFVGVTP